MRARVMDEAGIFEITRVGDRAEHLLPDGLREPEDRVQRRAQLVPNLSEKARLCAVDLVGAVGYLPRLHQIIAHLTLDYGPPLHLPPRGTLAPAADIFQTPSDRYHAV